MNNGNTYHYRNPRREEQLLSVAEERNEMLQEENNNPNADKFENMTVFNGIHKIVERDIDENQYHSDVET